MTRALIIKACGDKPLANAMSDMLIARDMDVMRARLENAESRLELSEHIKAVRNARKLAELLEKYKRPPEPWYKRALECIGIWVYALTNTPLIVRVSNNARLI